MNKIIIALDFPNKNHVETFLKHFNEPLFVKVGMELYYQEGPSIVKYLKDQGHHVFLDLKLHDIPNTVESAMRGLAKLGVDMTNVHAAGGIEMMQAAKRGLGEGPLLIAVTQLTSTSEEQMHHDQLIKTTLNESVVHYAKGAMEAGLDGVVCSPLESKMIKEATNDTFITVTPGVRPASSEASDQKRVTTPKQAFENGSTYIVVGRPITRAQNPNEAYQEMKEEIK